MKFRRPRNRRPNTSTSLKNQNFDSNGPTGKIRGTAQQIYEKYTGLARDVGVGLNLDRVLAEKYYQFADHYYRLLLEAREQEERNQPKPQERNIQNQDSQEQPEYRSSQSEGENKTDEMKKVSVSNAQDRGPRRYQPKPVVEASVPLSDVDFLSVDVESMPKVEKEEKEVATQKKVRVPKKKIEKKASDFPSVSEEISGIKVMGLDES